MTEAKNEKGTKYRTTNWKTYNAALKARGSLTMWLDQGMQWLGTPSGKRGRSPTFSDAAIQFCLSIKSLFGQPLRKALGMVQSLLRLAKLDWPVPDFSTVCRRHKTLQVELSYQRPQKNASHWKKSSPGWAHRNEAIAACKRLGRSIWKKWSGYHRRSLVQTKMHCFKQLGQRVTARTFERQVVELHVRVALLNRFSQIGRPRTVPVAAVA